MNVLENQKDNPQGKHLSVRGNFRSVHLDQEKAIPISLPSTLFQHGLRNEDPGREREGTLQNGHICTSWSVPWASAGERETLNRLNMRRSWHLTDMDLGNPEWWKVWNGCKVMQEMRMQWRVGDDSPWGGWARSHFYLLWSQPLCPPEVSYYEILIPMVMVTPGGAFVKWRSYKDEASSMRWVLLCIRDAQSSRALLPCEDTVRSVWPKRTLHDHAVEIHFHCF